MSSSDAAQHPRRAFGRVVFDQPASDGTDLGVHNVRLEIWAYHPFLPDQQLGSGSTDGEGRFDLRFKDNAFGLIRDVDIDVKVMDVRHTYAPDGTVEVAHRCLHSSRFDIDESRWDHDLGVIRAGYWGYRSDFPTPRTAKNSEGELPQDNPPAFKSQFARELLRYAGALALQTAANKFDSDKPLRSKIQAAYPTNLTQEADAVEPGWSRSDAWFGTRMLNGHGCVLLGQDNDNPGLLRARYDWGETPSDGVHDLTDCDMSFEVVDQSLMPRILRLRIRRPGGDGAWASEGEWITYTPDDGELWEQAKRVCRVHHFLYGELYNHIVCGHLRGEQYALPMFRNLRHSPLRRLFEPHMQQIVPVNVTGDSGAWGGPVPNGSGFTNQGVLDYIVEYSSWQCWRDWSPRQPVCDDAVFARGGQLYWEFLGEYLDAWFGQHAEEITATWPEIHRFSAELVARSYAYKPRPAEPSITFHDTTELDDSKAPRQEIDGVVRSIRPVTNTDEPADGEMELLRQLCRYVIYHATYWHGWIHDRQWDDGSEAAYGSLGLVNGSMGPESDESIGPLAKDSIEGLFTIAIGTGVRYAFMLANEERDIPPLMLETLERYRARFEALGIDLAKIRSRINI